MLSNLLARVIAICGGLLLPLAADQCGDFAYTDNGNNTATITGYTGPGGTVNIPGTINGLMVQTIGSMAFCNNTALTSVIIADGVTSIGNEAFENCRNLTSVTISSSINTIGEGAFYSCTSLATVTIPNSVTNIRGNAFYLCASLISVTIPYGVTNIGPFAFADCRSLTEIVVDTANPNYSSLDGVLYNNIQTILIQYPGGRVGSHTIPGGVVSIGQNAYARCAGLTSVVIPNSVTTIGEFAFGGCTGLISITIPIGITSIGTYAFGQCTGLTDITVDARNSSYSSLDGVLFNKNQTSLILYPGGKAGPYTVPGSVTSIGKDTFYNCTGLTSVTIPNSVTNIDTWAFSYCTSLTSVFFPGNAPTVATGIFSVTASGFKVYFVSGATGFTTPIWQGYPSGMLEVGTPWAVTGPAILLARNAFTLTGTINPNGYATIAFYEYGPTSALGSTSPALAAGNGTISANLSWPVSDLKLGTIYYYRLVATNGQGTTRGDIHTFTTNFPRPVAVTGSASPAGTTGASITGTVRAMGTTAEVFLDFGTDGVTFQSSVAATPATVTGDTDTPVTAALTNLQQGVTYYYRLRAVSPGGTGTGETGSFTPAILSGLTWVFPDAPPAAGGQITVTLNPAGLATGWRFAGERQWRASGAVATGLPVGDRLIEFRPLTGHIPPPAETVTLTAESPVPLALERDYYETQAAETGGVSITLKPDDISAPGVPAAIRAQWRLLGEDDSSWRDSGTSVTGLPVGTHVIECKPVAGRTAPPLTSVAVASNSTASPTLTYFLAPSGTGVSPVVQPFATVSGDQALPYAFVGQIRTSAGLGSGTVVKPRVVATAAHVVWDDGTLSAATDIQWLLQRDRNTFEPVPQVPRGFYLFDGYAAQRTADNSPGVSSPQAQNLDVAALYFTENAGRGGYSGFLASDTTVNEFLTSSAAKILAGYAVDGIATADQGRMHATPPVTAAFAQGFGRTHSSVALRGVGGMSGGPLFVQHQGHFYPAGVYLGGTSETIVRAFDSLTITMFDRAALSGGDGENHTGGGVTHSNFSITGGSTDPGALQITIQPSAAVTAGAGWRLKPETAFRSSGAQKNGLKAGSYIIEFKTIPGYQTPAPQTLAISGGMLAEITYSYGALNAPPVIGALADLAMDEDATGHEIAFAVSDPDTSLDALVVEAASSNPALIPVSGIVLGGTGANRTVTVTPLPNQYGTTVITLTVSDGSLSASTGLTVTVNPVNDPPTVSQPPDLTIPVNTSAPGVLLAIGDVETDPASLTVTATSSDPALVPVGGLVMGGSGAERSLSITPTPNRLGQAIITVEVGDGDRTTTVSFPFTVTGTPLETWRYAEFATTDPSGPAAGTADPDGDGQNNLAEFTAGTGPNDPTSVFKILTTAKTATTFTVTAAGRAGRCYALERLTASGAWEDIATTPALPADAPVTITDPAAPSARSIYRIKVTLP